MKSILEERDTGVMEDFITISKLVLILILYIINKNWELYSIMIGTNLYRQGGNIYYLDFLIEY